MKAKVLLKYSKYGIPIVIFVSIIQQFYYYFLFDIDLASYITLLEVPLLFTGNFLFLFSLSILPFAILVSLFGKRIGAENTALIEEASTVPPKERFKLYFKENLLMIIIILLYFVFSIFKLPIFLYSAIILSASMFFNIIIKESIIANNIQLNDETVTALNTLQFLFTILVLSLILSNYRADRIKKGFSDNSITIVTEKRTYFCKYTLRYIGRTTNYTFIYDQKRQRTEVLKNSDILTEKKELSK